MSPQIVGIDAGGTKLAVGLVDLATATIIGRAEAPTRAHRGAEAVLTDCVAMAREIAPGGRADGIGIGVPELVSLDGQITSAAAWDWRGTDLASAFQEIGPVHVESDVRAAALAEAWRGAGRGLSSFLYLTIGTGVSHTFVIDGSPWAGARGNAVVVGAPLAELSASGAALATRAGKARAEDVLACPADSGIVEDVAQALATELARLVNALDPEAVIIGGGLGLADAFRLHFIPLARKLIYAAGTRDLRIIGAGLGRDAGVVGAALAAGRRLAGAAGPSLTRQNS